MFSKNGSRHQGNENDCGLDFKNGIHDLYRHPS